MENYKEINGDLVELALKGEFAVVTHGCNCFCTMGAGIAPQMAKAFSCDKFKQEQKLPRFIGNINKLGTIDFERKEIYNKEDAVFHSLHVVNSYTQYHYGKNYTNDLSTPLDYEALTLCLRKINHVFKGNHIGLPQIGCGLAGGDWNKVKEIIKKELKDCIITVVIYKK